MDTGIQKNQIVTVVIEDMTHDGEGVGKADGFPLFIKDTVIGDEVEVKVIKTKKNYGYGRMMKLRKASPYRVEPVCRFHRQCGGCQIQTMDYDKQLEFKQNKVRNNLLRIGGFSAEMIDTIMEPIVGMDDPFHYRNKAQFPVGVNRDGEIVTGFFAGRTHDIIPNTDCALGVRENQKILEMVLQYMKDQRVDAYDEKTGRGTIRHILIRKSWSLGQLMVCLVINGKVLPKAEELVDLLQEIPGMHSISMNINEERNNVILGKETKTLWGEPTICDRIGELDFSISPQSFFQVNPKQTDKLYSLAKEYAGLTGKETVWDLYCGIGTISLYLSSGAKQVYGVEIVPQAIEDAKENAKRNHVENARFYVGKAEEVLPQKYKEEGIYADVIVVDPPRKGCDRMCLDTMIQMAPQRIVYVSCDSATMARDLNILCENGYELKRIRAVDQFPQTVHTETCCLLAKRKPDTYVHLTVDMKDYYRIKDEGRTDRSDENE